LGGQFRRKAPTIFFSYPPIFQFWGTLISHIDESGTDFMVQTPVSVKQSTGEKTKRGRSLRGEGSLLPHNQTFQKFKHIIGHTPHGRSISKEMFKAKN